MGAPYRRPGGGARCRAADADLTTRANLRREIAAYRDTLAECHARRVGPADQLAAAQRTVGDARANAAAAGATLEALRAKLGDSLRLTIGPAGYAYLTRTCAVHFVKGAAGLHVDQQGFIDSRSILTGLFEVSGLETLAMPRGRAAAVVEMKRHRRT